MNNYYYFDDKECEFIPVEYHLLDRVVYTLSLWTFLGTVLSVIFLSILSFSVGSPAEIVLKAENDVLYQQLDKTRSTIERLDQQISELASIDNEVYRTVLGIDPLSEDERKAGVGGADLLAEFDVYSAKTEEILRWTTTNLESIERRINIQKLSFMEIKSHYNENRELMQNIPAIRPISGLMLSGYGVRRHPVLGYQRMHEGVDFRARVGEPVYATGDGVLKSMKRRGTYGLMLVIDHGHGYETRYAHLSRATEDIRPGVKVKRGQKIAYSGNSGVTSGPHLHYEIKRNGKSVDPLNYMFADLTPDEYLEFQRISERNLVSMD